MFMGVVDTIMVGPLGPAAIGAVSIGHILVDLVAVAGLGLLLGLDTVVSQSYGAGDIADCNHSLWQGLYLAAVLSPVGVLAVYAAPSVLAISGVHASVAAFALPYVFSLQWGLPPVLFYTAFRRYLQGITLVRPVMITLLSANVINYLGNWWFIPSYGVAGAGWATVVSRIYMAVILCAVAMYHHPELFRRIPRPDFERLALLLRLGVPAAGHILLETGVFAAATVLAGRLPPESLAAHHVMLNIAGTTFMVPLGFSSAAAVSVGHAVGAGDFFRAKRTGWLAVLCGAGFMVGAALMLLAIPETLIGIFTTNAEVFAVAIPLLLVAALFQLFDGLQVVVTGALRGAGDTRTPMFVNLMGHLLLGLPIGYVLCFVLGYGVTGLWIGLSVGLIVVGSVLLLVWARLRLPLSSASSSHREPLSL